MPKPNRKPATPEDPQGEVTPLVTICGNGYALVFETGTPPLGLAAVEVTQARADELFTEGVNYVPEPERWDVLAAVRHLL